MDLSDAYHRLGVGAGNAFIDFQAERSFAQKDAPAEVYHHKLEGKRLPFVFNFSQFKADKTKSRTEVYIGVSTNKMEFIPISNGLSTTLVYTIAFQDTNFNTVERRTKRLPLQTTLENSNKSVLYLHQENFNLMPGKYRMAIKIENPQGNSRSHYVTGIEIHDFAPKKLTISDIQLASNIEPADNEGMFNKKGLHIMPYPYNAVRISKPISIYFETYNLNYNSRGRSDYTVTYKVNIVKEKRGFFSKTFGAIGRLFKSSEKHGISTSYTQSDSNSTVNSYLSLDMSLLKLGLAELIVTVKDNCTGDEVESKHNLQLIE